MTEQIFKNIYSINVPLPGNPLKWLNSYFIRGENGCRSLLIDTGFNRPECLEALMSGLRELNADLAQTDVFLTHVHSDHTGNAAALQSLGSRIIFNALDYHDIQTLDWPKRGRWFVTEGMPGDVCANVLKNNPAILYAPGKFTADTVLDGDILEYGDHVLKCVQTPGHCLGHMCLYSEKEKLLFSGDHILFDITPNICSMGTDTDMLGKYLDNLRRIRTLDIDTVLPGHRTSGSCSVYQRIDALLEHHRVRLAEAEKIVSESDGLSAYEIAGRMRWSIRAKNWDDFPPGQKWFAMGEALSHLDRLRNENKIIRENGSDGIFRYRTK